MNGRIMAVLAVAAGLLIMSLAAGCRSDEPRDIEDVRQDLRDQVRQEALEGTSYMIDSSGRQITKPDVELKDTEVTSGELEQLRIQDAEGEGLDLPKDENEVFGDPDGQSEEGEDPGEVFGE